MFVKGLSSVHMMKVISKHSEIVQVGWTKSFIMMKLQSVLLRTSDFASWCAIQALNEVEDESLYLRDSERSEDEVDASDSVTFNSNMDMSR